MAGGRPSKYDPAYCDAVVEHMKDGAIVTSFAAEIGVARETITGWMNEHEEFSLAVKRGKAACAAWWEKIGRTNAKDGGGNATLVIFGLKNMAADDWRDKHEIQQSGELNVITKIEREIVRPKNTDSGGVPPTA